jgi:hypothetical protein
VGSGGRRTGVERLERPADDPGDGEDAIAVIASMAARSRRSAVACRLIMGLVSFEVRTVAAGRAYRTGVILR